MYRETSKTVSILAWNFWETTKGRVKNVPRWVPHYQVPHRSWKSRFTDNIREREQHPCFKALYQIYYYNIFVSTRKKKQLSLSKVSLTSLGCPFWISCTNAFLLHFFQFYFTKGVSETPKVSLKVNCFIVSGFQKSILNTSCKDPKVTSARYVTSGRPQDVNFEHKYKTHFCGIVFQF